MAFCGDPVAPPKLGQPVPKEYVRQQVRKLGIRNVSEEDLEHYAADLTKLVRRNLVGEPQGSASLQLPSYGKRGSAVFKTFPDDKENMVHYITPSPTSSPRLVPTRPITHVREHVSPLTSSLGNTPPDPFSQKLKMKRKVLRQGGGASRVVEESDSDLDSETSKLAEDLSALSLTSLSTSTAPSGLDIELVPDSSTESSTSIRPITGLKSFIRPSTAHPHTRGLKRSDPVARYHEYRELWEHLKPPGERPRNALRWHIREQMMHQDVPYYEPRRRVLSANNYVVPTDKKRTALHWQVRHALALQ